LNATAWRFRPAHETTEARLYDFFPQVHSANFGTRLSHSLDKVIQQKFSAAVYACSGT
jgi:Tfp pilus assembly pilus retraction ATPase PilT